MAEFSFPFDSKFISLSPSGLPVGDRDGSAKDFREYDLDRYTNGVNVNENPDALLVVAGSGMTGNIQEGKAYIQGVRYKVDGAGLALTIPNGSSQPRVDRIVVTMDDHEAIRSAAASVKVGTPAASPLPPALTRVADATGETYMISLMRILVPTNATNISQCTLIDERADSDVCGYSLSRRAPQPPMPEDAVLYSEVGVAGGVAAFDHVHDDYEDDIEQAQEDIISLQAGHVSDVSSITELQRQNTPLPTGGTAPNFTVADTSVTSLTAGLVRTVVFSADSSAPTLNFTSSGAGAKNLLQSTGKAASVKAGQHVRVQYNGTGFFTVSGGGGVDRLITELIISSKTWTMPKGIKDNSVNARLFGGGGGGTAASAAGGGGGGHMAAGSFTIAPDTNVAITIGAGGGQSAAGGVTSFGAYLSASGGSPNSAGAGGAGGSGGGGGGAGGAGAGGNGSYGGGGGSGGGVSTRSTGGTSGGRGGGSGGGATPVNGTNTTGLNLEFTGSGTAGTNGTGGTYAGCGGDGGYGGSGGNGGNSYSSSRYGGGGGGGGYGAAGGNGLSGNSSYSTAGGGGGGYGGRGGDGDSGSTYCGGGGGGYGPLRAIGWPASHGSGFGSGGAGTYSGIAANASGMSGICILTYILQVIE